MGKKKSLLNIPPEEEQTGILLWFQHLQNHWMTLFMANLLAVLSLAPAIFCLYLMLDTMDLVFAVAALVCLSIAGPSITELHSACVRVVHRMPVWLANDFKTVWKEDWKKSMVLTAVLGLLWAALIYAAYLVVVVDGGLSLGHLLLVGLCAYMLMGLTLFSYQQLAMLELPLGTILKNSLLLIFAGRLRSVFAILVSLAVALACVAFYGYAIYALLLGVPALAVMTSNLIFAPVFRQLFLKGSANEEET